MATTSSPTSETSNNNDDGVTLAEPALALDIPIRNPLTQTINIEPIDENLNIVTLILGILFIWITYGSTSITGSLILTNETVNNFDLIYWMSLARFIGNIITMGLLHFFDEGSKTEIKMNKYSIISMILPFFGLVGWFFFLRLLRFGDISIINPFINLYVIIPIILATFLQGRKFTLLKVFGTLIGIVAGCLFGVINSSTPSELPAWEQVLYFILVFGVWSFVDTFSAVMGAGELSMLGIMFFNAIGYLFCTMISSLVIRFTYYEASDFSYFKIGLMASNALLPIGWLTFVYLCKYDASVVTPLFSLNFILPVIFGIIYNEEGVNAVKIIALCLTGLSVVIIGRSLSTNIKNNGENSDAQVSPEQNDNSEP